MRTEAKQVIQDTLKGKHDRDFDFTHILLSLLFLFSLLLLVGLYSLPAHADGGAPQLAYVAGATQGISIIDIARRRVTGTIAVEGDPRTVLLSPARYALHLTPPTLRPLPPLIARTRRTPCTAT